MSFLPYRRFLWLHLKVGYVCVLNLDSSVASTAMGVGRGQGDLHPPNFDI